MRLPLLVGSSALVLPMAAGAQSVTEEEFLSSFKEESPAVRALTDGLARAEAARKRAGRSSNPRVDFWREQPDANPRVTNWTLSWTPPFDGRYGLAKEGADAGLAAARERLAVDKAGCAASFVRPSRHGAWPASGATCSGTARAGSEPRRSRAAAGARGRGVRALGPALHARGGRGPRGGASGGGGVARRPKRWRAPGVPTWRRSAVPRGRDAAGAARRRRRCDHAPELRALTLRGGAGGARAEARRPLPGFPDAAVRLAAARETVGSSGAVRSSPPAGPSPLFDRDQARAIEAEAAPAGRRGSLRSGAGARRAEIDGRAGGLPHALHRVARSAPHGPKIASG